LITRFRIDGQDFRLTTDGEAVWCQSCEGDMGAGIHMGGPAVGMGPIPSRLVNPTGVSSSAEGEEDFSIAHEKRWKRTVEALVAVEDVMGLDGNHGDF
tara:strand:- start:341 stop:634 length:294 start_codon:yes stop_codon:yes gene_type:complete